MARSQPLHALKALFAFDVWGWMTLVVVLLSAAPTGGALRTQWIGSAFDPSTYSLTTGAKRFRAPSEQRYQQLEPPAKPVTSIGDFATQALAAPALAARQAGAGPAVVPSELARPHGSTVSRNLAPRGPPTA
ncbi:hypothetical protein [Tsuneonella sp. HG222]